MQIKKPMLACPVEDLEAYFAKHGTLAATNKIDGIRALMVDGQLVSRKFKAIPNEYIRTALSKVLPDGADGELVLGDNFQESTSAIMSHDGEPQGISFMWFDYLKDDPSKPYMDRMKDMAEYVQNHPELAACPIQIMLLLPTLVNSIEEFRAIEEAILAQGGEGVMLRTLDGPYKFGRSTAREGYLVKVKQFVDSEAKIVGFVEKMHNANEAELDAFGNTKRSKKKENLVPAGTLGTLQVVDIHSGVEFEIGVFKGLTAPQLQDIWNNRSQYLGKIVNYTYQPAGVKEKPRIPSFRGFRHEDDV
jgi:DNA ligase-1